MSKMVLQCYDHEMSDKMQTDGQTDERRISSSYFRQTVNSLCEKIILGKL